MTALLETHPRPETPQLQHRLTTTSSSPRHTTSQRRLQLSPTVPPQSANDPGAAAAAHGISADMTLRSDANDSVASAARAANTNGHSSQFMAQTNGGPGHDTSTNGGDAGRPLSAPGRKNGLSSSETRDDSGPERQRRPTKPLLVRSKSDYARPQDDSDADEDEIPEWGARHGFEDHYQSEHIITQLATVCCAAASRRAHLTSNGQETNMNPHRTGACTSQTSDTKPRAAQRAYSASYKTGGKEIGLRPYPPPSPCASTSASNLPTS